jgi:L-galactono-1,4-lactone dehydrogenase
VSPANGPLSLSRNTDTRGGPDANKKLFDLARVGLGSLGIVTELTLRCIPKFLLKEDTFPLDTKALLTGSEGIIEHYNRLKSYRHVRYMWIPFTNSVIAVVSNPCEGQKSKIEENKQETKPLVDLLLESNPSFDRELAESFRFSQLREALLDLDPLDVNHIKKVNHAEEEFWKLSSGLFLSITITKRKNLKIMLIF